MGVARFSLGEAGDAEVKVFTCIIGAPDANLAVLGQLCPEVIIGIDLLST